MKMITAVSLLTLLGVEALKPCKHCKKQFSGKKTWKSHLPKCENFQTFKSQQEPGLDFTHKIKQFCSCGEGAPEICIFYAMHIASSLYKACLKQPTLKEMPKAASARLVHTAAKEAYDACKKQNENNALAKLRAKLDETKVSWQNAVEKSIPAQLGSIRKELPADWTRIFEGKTHVETFRGDKRYGLVETSKIGSIINSALTKKKHPVVLIEARGNFSIFVRVNETEGFYLETHTSDKNYQTLANRLTSQVSNKKLKKAFGGKLYYGPITAIEAFLTKSFQARRHWSKGKITLYGFNKAEKSAPRCPLRSIPTTLVAILLLVGIIMLLWVCRSRPTKEGDLSDGDKPDSSCD